MEQEQDSASIARVQHQLHLLPEEWRAAATAVEPLLDRIATDENATQLLVIASDSEAAVGLARRLAPAASRKALNMVAVTDARRSARVIRTAPAQIVVGHASALLELIQATTLKIDDVRLVVLAWVDGLDASATRALETVMAAVPKDSGRIVFANSATPAVEHLVERYARRPRRVQSPTWDAASSTPMSYIAVSEAGRLGVLRQVLDELDPESALVVVHDEDSRPAVEALLRSLGYDSRASTVRLVNAADAGAAVVIYFDLPASEDEVRSLGAPRASSRTVALVTARQLRALRRLGMSPTPLTLPEAAARARRHEDTVRDELRTALAAGQNSRELLAIEPLLSDYDGAEIAAAALRLLEAERARRPVPGTQQPAMTRLHLNVGAMDNVRAGDLVGAITNEAGISKADLGRVEVRERFSTVEIATPMANAVVSKLTGISIKGRRVVARVDEGRERRDRGDRPARGDGPDRDNRPVRSRRDDVRIGTRGAPRKR